MRYDSLLVVVSIVVAALASYAALDLTSRISASRGRAARAWLGGGAVAMGVGIWSMHFIGMLAFNSPIPLGYDIATTVLSLLIAITASAFALHVVSRPSLTWQLLLAAGVIMGIAIVSMHYVGMAAIVLNPPLTYDPRLVVASVGVAIVASVVALALAFKLRRSSTWPRTVKLGSASIMGLAISGMHYTGMAAAHISPDAVCLSGAVTDEFWLAGAVATATVAILSTTLILSFMDAHMTARTERITASLQHATESNKAKDEFLAVLGHELRNPLAAISNAATLLDETGTAASQFAREVIHRQTTHLRRMVDDLLDLGRANSGKMQLNRQPIDLYACVTNATAAMLASGRAAKHQVRCSGSSVWIDADATRIEQIVANLLTNALTYSPPGSDVAVRVDDNHEAVLTIRDSGIGLEADELSRVFDLFYQSDRAELSRTRRGLGIGLALVRRLVELHGGTIDISSRGRGSGTTVTVRVPRIKQPNTPSRTKTAGPGGYSRKIVIVDDDADVLQSLVLLLLRRGHTVFSAEDGAVGLQRIRAERPEVGIIDIGMPRLNGYELARQVRAEHIPVYLVALTGYGQPEDRERAREAGFDAHVTKPADIAQLEQLLATAPFRHA